MPAAYLMSWEPKARRWWKMYRGVRYVRSCRQLGAPATKDGSYRAANAWWTDKEAEIEGSTPPHPQAEAIAKLERRLSYVHEHGLVDESAPIRKRLAAVRLSAATSPVDVDAISDGQMSAIKILLGVEDTEDNRRFLASLINIPRWDDRERIDTANPVAVDRTLEACIHSWLKTQFDRMRAGGISPGAYENLRREAERFRDYAGSSRDVATINEVVVDTYYNHLLKLTGDRTRSGTGAGMSADSAKTALRVMRTIVHHLHNLRLLTELPRNLDAGCFTVAVAKVKIFTVDQVKILLAASTGQMRLHIMIALNCGMYAGDISDLRDDEVDWQQGRIIRKRSKERGVKDAPTVNYKLWIKTFELLKEHRSGGATVLLTKSGGSWCWESIGDDGKLRSSDNVATNFTRLRSKIGGGLLPFKHLRKTGNSLFKTQADFTDLGSHYLGQVPQTVEGRHYSVPPQIRFDRALAWLGSQFGL